MKIREGYAIKEIAGEQVVIKQGRVGMDMTKVISFNPVAAWLWRYFDGKEFTESDVARLIADTYDVPFDRASKDAVKWVKQLEQAELI